MRIDRTRAVQLQAPAGRRAPLTPERIAGIRARIASGAYDGPRVDRYVASQILRSGDLDAPQPGTGRER